MRLESARARKGDESTNKSCCSASLSRSAIMGDKVVRDDPYVTYRVFVAYAAFQGASGNTLAVWRIRLLTSAANGCSSPLQEIVHGTLHEMRSGSGGRSGLLS